MNAEKLALRKNIIRLHEKGRSQDDIAYALDTSQSTVSYWIIRWKKTGNLGDLPRSGKPSRLSQEQLEELKAVLLDFPPPRFGGESMGWTTKMALAYVRDMYGVAYGMRQMQKLFHKLGLRLITPRPQHRKASYAAKVVYRMDFKKNSKKNIWVAPSLISAKQHLG